MATSVDLRYESIDLSTRAGKREYVITGTDSETDARTALIAEAPSAFGGLALYDASVAEVGDAEETETWIGTASYQDSSSFSEPPAEGESQFSFDTSGITEKILLSRETIATYKAGGGSAPSEYGAINVNKTNGVKNAEGTDIVVPTYSFQETHYKDNDDITNTYKGVLFTLTGTTNNASFKGFSAGEVLFIGASGTRRGTNGLWEITYKFQARPNRTNVSIGGVITVTSLKGWEVLWVVWKDKDDTTNKCVVKQPLYAYVERVYEAGDFSTLAIGTT